MRVLIIDDQPGDRLILRKVLRELGDIELAEADSLAAARRAIEADAFDAAIVDLRLGEDLRNRDGHVLVRELRQRTTTVPIVWTATREIHEIREAMRNGAYDYIFKDAPYKELVARVIEGLRSRRSLEREVLEHRARRTLDQPIVHGMVGDSEPIMRLREDVKAIAVGSDRPVLILGPSGAGKELVARAIHALGPHPDATFVAKNCAAIPESLFESELFGHEEHAFTGAKRRAGALGSTGKGTLFLDEIGEMPLGQQAKLLRVLEARRYTPLGADVERPFHGRVVAATLVDLEERVKRGAFRHDLYMRLSFFPIRVPPLKDHAEDIPAIIEHYIGASGLRPLRFSPDALRDLMVRAWPGNVRELQQVVERIAIRPPAEGVVRPEHVAAAMSSPPPAAADLLRSAARMLLTAVGAQNLAVSDERHEQRVDLIEEMTAALFREALARCDHKRARAARLVGTDRRVIERFMKRGAPAQAAFDLAAQGDVVAAEDPDEDG
ncbi:sigma-54-dependent transcriptional regulator [Sorangium cellulosum]|uniref:Acetoacetate metabolism regulatory protein AtoC n=1 Tax=Sorangium cellulosum So0157-2 TaxID=1254432 RepID=S4XIZ4_SORCE|nr:sigma-54 dependent transcriptional regulator [Sorangium cellulosum]AGP32506.1 acetoacetate metabolism regulatory protein AtoC [Sorangium cellulosum So0157-2]